MSYKENAGRGVGEMGVFGIAEVMEIGGEGMGTYDKNCVII